MLIDTHCHIDLFDDPITQAKSFEGKKNICIAMTMLPNHYLLAKSHLNSYNYVHPSLGMHPLRICEGKPEISLFIKHLKKESFIGEIGLDYYSEGKQTKSQQLSFMNQILPTIGQNKFLSMHSRHAHEEIMTLLEKYNVGPVCFHYFIGGINAAEEIARHGHCFSFNLRMICGKQRRLLDYVDKKQILVESDGPFLTKNPIADIEKTYNKLSEIWDLERFEVEELLKTNFENCRTI